VSFAETQMDFDPNNMPQRAVDMFSRQDDHAHQYLSMLESRDKKLVQQNKQQQVEKQKQKFDEKSKVSEFVFVFSCPAADLLNTADGLVAENAGNN